MLHYVVRAIYLSIMSLAAICGFQGLLDSDCGNVAEVADSERGQLEEHVSQVFSHRPESVTAAWLDGVAKQMLLQQISHDYALEHPPLYTHYFTPEEICNYLGVHVKDQRDSDYLNIFTHYSYVNSPDACCCETRSDIKDALHIHMEVVVTPFVISQKPEGYAAFALHHELSHLRQACNELALFIQHVETYRDAYLQGEIDAIPTLDDADSEHTAAMILNSATESMYHTILHEVAYAIHTCKCNQDDTLTIPELYDADNLDEMDIQQYHNDVSACTPFYDIPYIRKVLVEIDAELEALRFTPRAQTHNCLDAMYRWCPFWARIDMLQDGYVSYSLFAYQYAN